MSDQVAQLLTKIDHDVTELVRLPVPEEDTPDTAGSCRAIENKLGNWRRSLVSEVPSTTKGKAYQVVVGRKATRSYSMAPIMASVGEKYPDDGAFQLLQRLIQSGAVKLTFGWQKLERFFQKEDLELRIVAHEILDDGDPDGPHVGAVWESTQSIETTGK